MQIAFPGADFMNGMSPILIVGAAGQVGRELQRAFAGCGSIAAVDRESVDLAVPDQIRELVRRVQPRILLNAAAYTAVDRAESEPDLARAINAVAPRILAEEARSLDALFVHYSTDYVFDGSKQEPWTEEDAPNPLSVYGATKLEGERGVQSAGGGFLIFRTSWVYGPHGHNFLFTMLRLARGRERLNIVDDQIGSPTSSIELAEATRAVVDGVLEGRFGAPHQSGGPLSHELRGPDHLVRICPRHHARAGKLLAGREPEVVPIATSEYPTAAMRPRNSVLSNEKLNACFGVRLAPWQTALETVLQRLETSDGAAIPPS